MIAMAGTEPGRSVDRGNPDAVDGATEERYGRIVALHLRDRNFEAARAAINRAEAELAQSRRDPLEYSVSEIGLPPRTVATLQAAEILTVDDLLSRTRAEMLTIPNLGMKTLVDILAALKRLGFGGRDAH